MPGNFESTIFSSTLFAEIYNFGPDHTSRISKYQNCWDFYDGKHWSQKAPEGFDQVTINFTKSFVKKIRRFAFRGDWNLFFSDEQEADGIDTWVNNVWKANNINQITNQIGDFGGIFGDWFVYPQWLPDETTIVGPDNIPSPHDVKLAVVDSRYVFPQYNNKTGEMEFCVIIIPYNSFSLVGSKIDAQQRLYREVHTKDKIYVQEIDVNNDVLEERTMDNPLGKILMVHGVFQPKAGSQFGAGMVEDMIESQKLLNEKVSDVSDIIDYHAAPITLIFGAKARSLERGANKIWAIANANARVENLSSEGNIPAARDFIDLTKEWMHELAGIPVDSLGAERKISNTSAVALAIDYEPLIELAEDVRTYFDIGIKKINELIIDIGIEIGAIKTSLTAPELYEHSIEHSPLLPRDRSQEINDCVAEVNAGFESKAGAMKRLGVKDVKAKMDEIAKETEETKKTNMELAQKYMDPAMVAQVGNADNLNKPTDAFQSGQGNTPEAKKARKAINKDPAVHGGQVLQDNLNKKG